MLTVLLAAAVFFGTVWILGRLARRFLQRAALAEARRPIPEAWRATVRARLPYIAALPPADQEGLLSHAKDLLAGVVWEGCGGLALTEEMRVVIAVQAALLTWKRDGPPFPHLKTILLYPTTFRPATPFRWVAEPSAQDKVPELGQSWSSGTIVLAWDDVLRGAAAPRDGHNVVLHEFAHQLDSADGVTDGIPSLSSAPAVEAWQHALLQAYDRLARTTAAGAASPLDRYGLTNLAEFFAVATEAFFERGVALRTAYPELYRRLSAFYRQDPASRFTAG